jgi:methyl-accepting chemotaxis protein
VDEVAKVVQEVQRGTAAVARSMDLGAQQVERNVALAARTGSALEEIIAMVRSAMAGVQTILSEAEATARASRVVLNAIDARNGHDAAADDIVKRSARNAAAAESASTAVEEITATMRAVSAAATDLAAIAKGLEGRLGEFQA